MTNGFSSKHNIALLDDIKIVSKQTHLVHRKREEEDKKLSRVKNDSNHLLDNKSYREFSTPSSAVSDGSLKTANSDYSFPSSGYHSSTTPLDNGYNAKLVRDTKKKFPLNHADKIAVSSTADLPTVAHWSDETLYVGESGISSVPTPPKEPEAAERQLDLDTRIELLLKGQTTGGLEPAFYKMVRKSLDGSDDMLLRDSLSPTCRVPSPPREPPLPPPPPPPPPPEEDPEKPLSRPPSPFLSKEVYLACHQRALELAEKAKQEEKLQTTKILEKVIKGNLYSQIKIDIFSFFVENHFRFIAIFCAQVTTIYLMIVN